MLFFSLFSFPHVHFSHDQGPLDMLYISLVYKLERLSPGVLEKNTVAQALSYLSLGFHVFALQVILI